MRSQSNVSTVRELLEQSFDMVVCLDCKARLGVSYGHRAGETGVYGNGYKPDGVPNASGLWKNSSCQHFLFSRHTSFPERDELRSAGY